MFIQRSRTWHLNDDYTIKDKCSDMGTDVGVCCFHNRCDTLFKTPRLEGFNKGEGRKGYEKKVAPFTLMPKTGRVLFG